MAVIGASAGARPYHRADQRPSRLHHLRLPGLHRAGVPARPAAAGGAEPAGPVVRHRALVGAVAAFTLVHELGHALAARRFGAESAISLSFLVGWASYRPTRRLRRSERIAITAAGPIVQIVLGSAVLLALGTTPWSYDDVRIRGPHAGPVVGGAGTGPGQPAAAQPDGRRQHPRHRHRRRAAGQGQPDRRVLDARVSPSVAVVAVALSPTYRPWALTVALFAIWNIRVVHGRPGPIPRRPGGGPPGVRGRPDGGAGGVDDRASPASSRRPTRRRRGTAPSSCTRPATTARPAGCWSRR